MKKTTHILLALCITIAMLAAAPVITARADCVELPADTWTCSGADTDGMDASGGSSTDTVTVNSGATVDNTLGDMTTIDMIDVTLTNNGDVANSEDVGAAIYGAGDANITNNGNIDANGFVAAGAVATDGDVTNNGSIVANGDIGTGVVADTGDVVNNGNITANGDLGTGVFTGSGDNTVTNNGVISATGPDGIAIVTGSGNDTVNLGAGSTTNGDDTALCTCDGDDTVNVEEGAAVKGAIDGGAGTDTLNFWMFTQSELDAFSAGSGSYGGYSWINFEKLIGLLLEKAKGDKKDHKGPRVYFKSEAALGVESDDKLGINVFAEPGLIAFIPFSSLGAIDPGVAGTRFEVPNKDNWYVVVINLGAVEGKPGLELYQVIIFDADGTLISDQQSFGY